MKSVVIVLKYDVVHAILLCNRVCNREPVRTRREQGHVHPGMRVYACTPKRMAEKIRQGLKVTRTKYAIHYNTVDKQTLLYLS